MFGLKRRPADPASLAPPQLRDEIDRLSSAADPSSEQLRRLVALRHALGVRLLDAPAADPVHPEPATHLLPESADGLPEIAAADLTPELLRAGILRDGCLLVRGLVPREQALALADGIEAAYAAREQGEDGDLYAPLTPQARFGEVEVRDWIKLGGGLLQADSPRLAHEVLKALQRGGVPALVEGYLGEPGLWTLEKTTLRKADPSIPGAWHQDGHFMGPVRALNLWLSLSRCGDESPGLDLVPRRLDELVTAGKDGAMLDYQVTDATAAAVAAPKQVIRPIFEPGDALLFDELFLHQTGSDPAMPKPRFALESWFFGASAFPDYAPLAI